LDRRDSQVSLDQKVLVVRMVSRDQLDVLVIRELEVTLDPLVILEILVELDLRDNKVSAIYTVITRVVNNG